MLRKAISSSIILMNGLFHMSLKFSPTLDEDCFDTERQCGAGERVR